MIIEFGFTSQGNAQVRVFDNYKTKSFTIPTHKNLPFTHSQTHKDLWHLTDKDKFKIESEVKDYTRKHGSEFENLIVFGKISVSANNKY